MSAGRGEGLQSMDLARIIKDIASEPVLGAREYIRMLFAILFSLSKRRIEAKTEEKTVKILGTKDQEIKDTGKDHE